MIEFDFKDRYDIGDLRRIIKLLRAPGGCPWDREQTHESTRRGFLEEAYEVAEAIDNKDLENLREELGDMMLQVLFHAEMEEEAGHFDADDVADAECKKLIHRHPHVFGDVRAEDSQTVLKNWDEIKRQEKKQDTAASSMRSVPRAMPALWRAEKVQRRGAEYDPGEWAAKRARECAGGEAEASDALLAAAERVERTAADFRAAAAQGADPELELGLLLFSCVGAAASLKIDPERALSRAVDEFIAQAELKESTSQDKH